MLFIGFDAEGCKTTTTKKELKATDEFTYHTCMPNTKIRFLKCIHTAGKILQKLQTTAKLAINPTRTKKNHNN